MEEQRWKIVGTYVRENIGKVLKKLER